MKGVDPSASVAKVSHPNNQNPENNESSFTEEDDVNPGDTSKSFPHRSSGYLPLRKMPASSQGV